MMSREELARLETDPHLPCIECGAPSVGAFPGYNTIWGGCQRHMDHPVFKTFARAESDRLLENIRKAGGEA